MNQFPFISVGLIAALTIGAGLLHGRMTDRWGSGESARAAADLLSQLPEEIGPWKLEAEGRQMSAEAERQLQCYGYAHGTYTNQETFERASLALLLGPPGPIAVHTPEICFNSREFRQQGSRKAVPVETGENDKHQMWSLRFESQRIEQTNLQVVYAWNGGDGWKASASPRWEYSGTPYLYKLQVACPLRDGNPAEGDPCQRFLQDFLPVANQYLLFEPRD